ncbi:hypothetical protein DPMN_097009 [Dreissena polymorpha]|uniref:Uncharacterized protein n=1 Tax=Dreissena polymorpha TaxID=45954 RepID=A0A9D4L9H3_DREPO|nr:hypothetical protein DPMN_097009 [Dreissena polymorpha]
MKMKQMANLRRPFFKGPIQDCTKVIYQERGFLGFLKGVLAMLYRAVPSAHEFLRATMQEHIVSANNGVIASLIADGIARCCNRASVIPFDVIKNHY